MPNIRFEPTTYVILISTFAIYCTAVTFAPPPYPGALVRVTSIALPAFEIFFLGLLAVFCWRAVPAKQRFIAFPVSVGIVVVTVTIFLAQALSLQLAAHLISPLAIANIEDAKYVIAPITVLGTGLVLVAACCVTVAGLSDLVKPTPAPYPLRFNLVALFILLACATAISERRKLAEVMEPLGFPKDVSSTFAPVMGLENTLSYRERSKANDAIAETVIGEIASGQRASLYPVDPASDFPFAKSKMNFGPLPFHVVGADSPINVIVLFLEGISTRSIEAYGGKYEDLMPALSQFARNNIVVEDYYNHTAPTYPGLSGTLASGIPWMNNKPTVLRIPSGIEQLQSKSIATVPNILSDLGYETTMFSGEPKNTDFSVFLTALGYDRIIAADDIHNDGSNRPARDAELFNAMLKSLDEREAADNSSPFFWSSYTVDSHAFSDTRPGEKKYGDGSNAALNRFHQLDAVLNDFFAAFENSAFADSTILIVTSDHPAYPEPPMIAAFSDTKNYTRHFVDQIPMIIRLPSGPSGLRIRNGYRSALDFAPTIFHLLGLPDTPNAFLGTSLFDKTFAPDRTFAMVQELFFEIDKLGVTQLSKSKHSLSHDQITWTGIVRYYSNTLEKDRLFPRQLTKLRDQNQ